MKTLTSHVESWLITKPKLPHPEGGSTTHLLLWKDFPFVFCLHQVNWFSSLLSGWSLSQRHPAGASPPSADLGPASLEVWRSLPTAGRSPRKPRPQEPAGGSPSGPGPPEGSAHRPAVGSHKGEWEENKWGKFKKEWSWGWKVFFMKLHLIKAASRADNRLPVSTTVHESSCDAWLQVGYYLAGCFFFKPILNVLDFRIYNDGLFCSFVNPFWMLLYK